VIRTGFAVAEKQTGVLQQDTCTKSATGVRMENAHARHDIYDLYTLLIGVFTMI
jgi:hypothetical protein